MKQNMYRILLLGFIAALISFAGNDLLAKQPATPIKLSTKVELKSDKRSDLTLSWVDGDVNNELGEKFLITQYKIVDGKEIEEQVKYVRRENDKNKEEYSHKISQLLNGNYCYVVTLVDTPNNVESDPSERACVKVGDDSEQNKDLYFNCKSKFVPLGDNGMGDFFVDVKNNSNCEFEVKVLKTDVEIEIAKYTNEGAMLKIGADEKGKHFALLGLVNKCSGEIVDQVELLICYGDCVNNTKRMFFAGVYLFQNLDDEGQATTRVKIVNETDCEFDVMVVESKVKIAVMELGKDFAEIKFTAEEKGKYKSIIGLRNKCTGEIVSKLTFDICYGDCNTNVPDLYFAKHTEFAHKLKEGEAWKYDVDAYSKNDCDLTYYFSDDTGADNNKPEGLEIDEETGVMSWENPVNGLYRFPIIVKATCDGGITVSTIRGDFVLVVGDGEPNYSSVLNCSFYDETDDVKDFHGKVVVWSAENRDPNNAHGYNFVKSVSLNGTSISIKLPAGKYYLKVDAKGYKQQYYETAFEIINAEIIEVGENEVVDLSMMLHRLPTPDYFEITGQVTDNATGEPVQSMVTFMPVKWILGGNGHVDPNGFTFENTVRTDEKGNYSIKLPNTWSYYGWADPIPTNTKNYKKQYYEGADTYYEADIIYLEDNLSDINFKLEERESYNGMISGSVTDADNNPIHSMVIALNIDKGDVDFKSVTRTDEKGYYYFENLKYGNYILLSLPEDVDYLPGYFVMGDFATLKWSEATVISVGDINPTVLYQIMHKKVSGERGKGIARIVGRIVKKLGGVSPGSGYEDNSISGGIVSLSDANNEIVAYYITDNNGYFELDGLTPGTYTMSVDKAGYDSYDETVEVDYSETLETETEVTLALSTTNVDYTDFEKSKLTISPMPVNEVSNISFEGVAGVSNISLVDMTGNVVYQMEINTTDGINQFAFDAKEIMSGSYLLIIRNGDSAIAGGITIIK